MKLINKERCIGCGVCHDVCEKECITMINGKDGFLYPVINEENCIKCGKCVYHCPISFSIRTKNTQYTSDSYIAWNLDNTKRKAGSSGGIFSIFAQEILNNGGVVIGAAYDEQLSVQHIVIEKVEDLIRLNGSKYLQSNTTGIYKRTKQILETGRIVLFSGTPCQIIALQAFLGKKVDNLITCEIFCHGVPSPGLFRDYIENLEKYQKSKVIEFNFRSKKFGWAFPHVSITLSNGKVLTHRHRDNFFMNCFGKHLSVRTSCFHCIAREKKHYYMENIEEEFQRTADISIGDFWGIQKHKPINTTLGVSALLINSEKGLMIFRACNNMIYSEKCKLQWVIEKNKYLLNDYPIPMDRSLFWKRYKTMKFSQFLVMYKAIFFVDLLWDKVKFELSKIMRVKTNEQK